MARFINRSNMLIFSTMLILGLVGLWLSGQIRDVAPEETVVEVPHIPDFTIEHFEAVAMDVNGKPRQRMTAPKLLHFADDGTASVENPIVIVYNDDTPPWQIEAERGWLSADANTLLLIDEVTAIREGDVDNEAIRIDTTDVEVDLVDDVATTDAKARIVSDSSVTESIGMRARFAENRLFLKQHARGKYVVPAS